MKEEKKKKCECDKRFMKLAIRQQREKKKSCKNENGTKKGVKNVFSVQDVQQKRESKSYPSTSDSKLIAF